MYSRFVVANINHVVSKLLSLSGALNDKYNIIEYTILKFYDMIILLYFESSTL